MAFLEVKDIVKDFGGLVANSNVSFQIEEGEIIGLIGPNGAGKTTLFNCIVGYYSPDSGRVAFKGNDITGLKPFQT
ncbi:MAG: ATP-binding cassette domain-containing protein, partial [Syntrophorhabdus sp.]